MDWTLTGLDKTIKVSPNDAQTYGNIDFKTFVIVKNSTFEEEGDGKLIFEVEGSFFAKTCNLVGTINEEGNSIVKNENLGNWHICF